MIHYNEIYRHFIDVYLDKKRVGYIIRVPGGFQYRPKGKNKQEYYGEVFNTINEVKASLEDD